MSSPRFYEGQSYDPSCSIGWLLKRTLLTMRRAVDGRMEAHGLTDAQWSPMLMLALGRASTPAELARELGIDTGSTTRTLDRLEDKGFVQRTRSAEDRRVVKLELTPAGRQVAGLVPDVISEVLNLHLVGFSQAEHDQLRDFLQRMMANGERMEAAQQAAGEPPQA
jgi:DNA-binding MarR family transcriptional regulator